VALKNFKSNNGGIVQRHESGKIAMKGGDGFLGGMEKDRGPVRFATVSAGLDDGPPLLSGIIL
jgi:hypothetical protein